MDFLKKHPIRLGTELPVTLEFEVENINDDYEFELWDVEKEECHGKLVIRKRKGCYLSVVVGEEYVCLGAGHYNIVIKKDCKECDCMLIRLDHECKVEFAGIRESKQECRICE